MGGKGASDSVDISVLRRRPKSCAVFVKKIIIYYDLFNKSSQVSTFSLTRSEPNQRL